MMKKSLAVLMCGAMIFGTASMTMAAEVEVPEAAQASYEKLLAAEESVMTTDNHPMMAEGLSFDIPEIDGDAEYCEENYE